MFRKYRNKKTGFCSFLLEKVATNTDYVTLNPGYLGQVKEMRNSKTLFKEIEIIKPTELVPDSINSILFARASTFEPKPDKIAREIIYGLADSIEKGWNSSKFHIMFHSSGYDSRILSGILSELSKKNGESWLGKILFICHQPEGQLFEKIMEFEGWKPTQYIVYSKNSSPAEYRSGLLNFTSCWKWANDAQPPVSIVGHIVEELIHDGVINNESPIQLISGSYGSETLDPKYTINYNNFINDLLQIHYYHRYSAGFSSLLHFFGDFIMPFVSMDALLLALKAKPIHDIRQLILKEISPQLLEIERYSGPIRNHDPYRNLSLKSQQLIEKEYRNSWYVKHVCLSVVKPPSTTFTQQWWSSYTAASLCEHLINKKVPINTPWKIHHTLKLWKNNNAEKNFNTLPKRAIRKVTRLIKRKHL
jgi:hypothetical protein